MISETAYSSQTKLLGQSLPIGEHGIGYLNLAFAANKGQKRLIFSFKPFKSLEGLEIQNWSINMNKFLIKNPLKIVNFYLAFMAYKSIKAKIEFLLHKCFEKSKFRLNTQIQKRSLKKDL